MTRWIVRSLSPVLMLLAVGCSAPAHTAEHTNDSGGLPVEFRFAGPDGSIVSGASTRGRATAIAFVTTYDVPSQLLLRRLAEVVRSVKPRSNAAAVLLEAPKYSALIPAYRDSLGLEFPVVMADHATLERRGPFGYIDRVPTTVVLDYRGREVWRYSGAAEVSDLRQALEAGGKESLGGGGPPPVSR